MTVTYKTNDAFPGIKFPRLHRVVYDRRLDESIAAGYQRSLKDHHVIHGSRPIAGILIIAVLDTFARSLLSLNVIRMRHFLP